MSELHCVRVVVREAAELHALLELGVDPGCRPAVDHIGGEHLVTVYATDEQLAEMQRGVAEVREAIRVDADGLRELVGQGDRFQGGRVLPIGHRER